MRFLTLMSIVLICICGIGFAAEDKEVPLNFDTQLIRIFEVAQTAPAWSPDHAVSAEDREVLSRILDKFRKHKMMLKNAVFRTDMNVIRITWGDDQDNDIVKAAYKTSKDPILGNSVYADKRQIVDVKISYRAGDAYNYLRIQNMENVIISNAAAGSDKPQPLPEKPTFNNYRVESKLTNEQCRFCHILAQNDGSPKGVFFPRYQESHKEHDIKNINALFHSDHFKLMPAGSSRALGLPEMGEDFLYQKVGIDMLDPPPENVRFTRILIELPQLVEVMARDNKQSMCVEVDFGTPSEKQAVSNYVCADNAKQRLSVKLTNPVLTSNKGSKEYVEPYFEKY